MIQNKDGVWCEGGHERLWRWFGLSYASWLTMPRVLMHEMPDEWQEKMAVLLEEYDDTWDFAPLDFGTKVQLTEGMSGGRFVKTPEWMINYRHPRQDEIDKFRREYLTEDKCTQEAV